VNVAFKDSQSHTPRTCHLFNYKNGTRLKPSLSSTMEFRLNDKALYLSIFVSGCLSIYDL
jgi:hypothetical protein